MNDIAAFILAGGKSTRMGADKAFVALDGRTLLARALEIARSVTEDVHIVGDATKFATFAQTQTGVAYGNPSTTQSATVTFVVLNQAGQVVGSTVQTLGPMAHTAFNVGPQVGLASFTGSLQITSTSPIISLSLNAEAFPVFSSLPPGDLPSSTVF